MFNFILDLEGINPFLEIVKSFPRASVKATVFVDSLPNVPKVQAKTTMLLQETIHYNHIYIYPIGSMYGIFTYIYHKNQPNVGKYTTQCRRIYQSHGSLGVCIYIYIYHQIIPLHVIQVRKNQEAVISYSKMR